MLSGGAAVQSLRHVRASLEMECRLQQVVRLQMGFVCRANDTSSVGQQKMSWFIYADCAAATSSNVIHSTLYSTNDIYILCDTKAKPYSKSEASKCYCIVRTYISRLRA